MVAIWAMVDAIRHMCLTHLLRDATYAVEEGDECFTLGFHVLPLRAVPLGRRLDTLKDTTLAQFGADLERRLDLLLTV